jgi:putative PIN family toxin of toxin-antitoxin system
MRVILDTNVLLDLFVFEAPAAEPLRQALFKQTFRALASAQTFAELADVIARDKFGLTSEQQHSILIRWRELSILIEDSSIQRSPWRCKDKADQVFLDLAYTFRPSMLLSKDLQVLKFQKRAARDGVIIDAQWRSQ